MLWLTEVQPTWVSLRANKQSTGTDRGTGGKQMKERVDERLWGGCDRRRGCRAEKDFAVQEVAKHLVVIWWQQQSSWNERSRERKRSMCQSDSDRLGNSEDEEQILRPPQEARRVDEDSAARLAALWGLIVMWFEPKMADGSKIAHTSYANGIKWYTFPLPKWACSPILPIWHYWWLMFVHVETIQHYIESWF